MNILLNENKYRTGGVNLNYRSKKFLGFSWIIIFLAGIYIIVFGVKNLTKNACKELCSDIRKNVWSDTIQLSTKMLFPIIDYTVCDSRNVPQKLSSFFSVYGYITPYTYEAIKENEIAENKLLQVDEDIEQEVMAENQEHYTDNINEHCSEVISDNIEEAVAKENEDVSQETESAASSEVVIEDSGIDESRQVTGTSYDASVLDFDFLMNNFYTVDSTTKVDKEQLDSKKLLDMDMTMKKDEGKPQILIYHTHSQEGFVDSKENDSSTTVVGIGEYLTKLLHEKYGYNVMHETTSYDLIDGKIDRNKAYSLACAKISAILKENPSIEVVIDLHRDGIEGEKLVTDIDGKKTAKIMFFNGLSYTNKNGKIGYLENPYINENLSFSLKLQIEAAKYYPGLMRKIYLKGYRYNLHLKPKALLIEVGAQNNTVEEEMNAMEPLADIIARVLSGEQ